MSSSLPLRGALTFSARRGFFIPRGGQSADRLSATKSLSLHSYGYDFSL